mgnify:FL=1
MKKILKHILSALALFMLALSPLCMAQDGSTSKSKDEGSQTKSNNYRGMIAPSTRHINPLQVGDQTPEVALRTLADKKTTLKKAMEGKPAVLIFYRGGWCPFCTNHLGKLKEIEGDLKALNMQIIAISPDRPQKAAETNQKVNPGYTILSDGPLTAAKAFGLAFELDARTLEKYSDYSLDLIAASGETHESLPVPAVYILDKKGVVRFAHVDPNYRNRLNNEAILKAAKALSK